MFWCGVAVIDVPCLLLLESLFCLPSAVTRRSGGAIPSHERSNSHLSFDSIIQIRIKKGIVFSRGSALYPANNLGNSQQSTREEHQGISREHF